jgi:hypothetical protein
MMRYLEGKFFLRGDEEFYRTGQVIKCTKETALVQYDQMENSGPTSMPMEIVCIHDEFAHGETKLGKVWGFFDTREQLDGYLKWVDAPQTKGQRVVKLVPKKPVP